MSRFIGKTYCKIDDKGRFLWPSKFYMLLPGIENENSPVELVIRKSDSLNCFTAYPKPYFEKLQKKIIGQLNPLIDEDEAAITSFYENIEDVPLDKQRRFKIPISVRAMFSDTVVLLGTGDFLQIWDKKAFEQKQEANKENGGHLSNTLKKLRDNKSGKTHLN